MDLLNDNGHLESHFNAFGDSVSVSTKTFWTRSMVLLGDEAQVDARFGLFGESANLDAG
jgi:hypothetical protein